MKRNDKLLSDVASQFERKCEVMNGCWLEEENVTEREMDATADMAATVLRAFVMVPPHERGSFLAHAASHPDFA